MKINSSFSNRTNLFREIISLSISLENLDFKAPDPPVVRKGRKQCVKRLGQMDMTLNTNDAVVETLRNR